MIHSLTIHNFQSHELTEMEFHPGVNIIVGSSDSGKSAILRSFRWVLENRPGGLAFCRYGAKEVAVRVRLADGGDVWRERGKTLNQYRLGDQAFKAPGTDVPREIAEVLDIAPVNVQGQFDAPFLLSESGGAIARRLNEIADLGSIDLTLSYLQGKQRENRTAVSHLEDTREHLKERLEEYEGLEEVESRVRAAECLETQVASLRAEIQRLKRLLQEIEETNRQVRRYSGARELRIRAEAIALRREQSVQKRREVVHILDLIQTTWKAQDYVDHYAEAGGLRARADALAERYEPTNGKMNYIDALVTHTGRCVALIATAMCERETRDAQAAELEAEFPDTCPLCGRSG